MKKNKLKYKLKKQKKIIQKNPPTKLSWPMSAKFDNFFYSKRKKPQNYHGP